MRFIQYIYTVWNFFRYTAVSSTETRQKKQVKKNDSDGSQEFPHKRSKGSITTT